MKRYDCIQFADVCEMRESEDGDYILHTDHAEAMASERARIVADINHALAGIVPPKAAWSKQEIWKQGARTAIEAVVAALAQSKTTSMPTPNIPDEVVEAAAKAIYAIANPRAVNELAAYAFAVEAIEVALPLLLEQKGWADQFGDVWLRREDAMSCEDNTPEPLYRLKVSNEQ